jgi:nitrate/nitrite transport system ATP-binding protein
MLDSLTRCELQQVLIELWRKNKITALMVTHDVDEALFLSDRIVCMTDGPAAEVGEIIDVRFPRPRERKAVMEHPEYYLLREQLIEFLEVRAHRGVPGGPGVSPAGSQTTEPHLTGEAPPLPETTPPTPPTISEPETANV